MRAVELDRVVVGFDEAILDHAKVIHHEAVRGRMPVADNLAVANDVAHAAGRAGKALGLDERDALDEQVRPIAIEMDRLLAHPTLSAGALFRRDNAPPMHLHVTQAKYTPP